ncbi:hypothetical protein G8770_13510 [Aestuariicella hydrocarbonica]|uniref:Uncharacterized protein n=1 Tax=Pseudomaricurvus hydrocarbonicus TaxID=1470433 RepID=A0A9E5MHX9_9GAMM|nr:hypothetical protein [Aestuariicella hydrocarbonica]NHO66561.1 hypothetical protein [Aestuariicella hydrocarbonica]
MKKSSLSLRHPLTQAVFCAVMLHSGYALSAVHGEEYLSFAEAPLTVQQLDRLRGGFLDKSGFKIQIGLEKVVLVDGMVAARSKLVIPEFNARAGIDVAMAEMDQTMDSAFELMDQALTKTARDLSSQPLNEAQHESIGGLASEVDEVQSVVAPIAEKASQAVKQVSGFQVNSKVSERTILSSVGATQSSVKSAGGAPTLVDSSEIQSALQPSMVLEQGLTQVLQTNSSTVVQNSADNRLIQTFDILNIELSNLSQGLGQKLNDKLLTQLMQYSR